MKLRPLWIAGLVFGIFLALGPLWGIAFTTIFMMRSFDHLHQSGIGNPQHLSNDIGNSMMSSVIGFVACPFGIFIAAISLIFLILSYKTPPPLPPTESNIQG